MSGLDGGAPAHDLLVLGSGVAGLSTAIRAAARGLRVVLLTKGETGHSATRYAQGGVAAALDPSDSPELHRSDTLAAGVGLCDADAVAALVGEGASRVRELIAMGAEFDRTGSGEAAALALAREGGHSTRRVVHAGGDATGAEIERALVAALSATHVEVREGWFAVDLAVTDGRCRGVVALDPEGRRHEVRATHTLLASGGAGQLYSVTTNPPPSTGDGTAMALRAGVPVADLEFLQFHPTALAHDSMPRPLLSEALRGEGAVLRDDQGVAFMAGEDPLGDLAPRDVVSRAIARRMIERDVDHLWLDATTIDDFSGRFPTIHRACTAVGLDPATEWLPVAPAAHYHCGGVLTDLRGATALPGLWAVGEAACTGAHGANRLASNSLLEGLVFAPRAVEAVVAGVDGWEPTGAARGVPPVTFRSSPASEFGLSRGDGEPSPLGADDLRRRLQRVMTTGAGVVRSERSLDETLVALDEIATQAAASNPSPAVGEVVNLAAVGEGLCRAAQLRRESRGAHTREEYPDADAALAGRLVHLDAERLEFVPLSRSDRAPVR